MDKLCFVSLNLKCNTTEDLIDFIHYVIFCTFLISYLESKVHVYQDLHDKYIFYTQTQESRNYFASLSMGKGILIYKQCLLVTSCNQALDHYVEWESVPDPGLSWLLTCVVHIGVGNPWFFCLVTGGGGSPRYFCIITDYAIIPFFQNAGILQLSKHCLLLLLREKMLLLLFMHLGFFTYLTDFAFFPDIYKWRPFQASAPSLNK